MRRPRRRTSVPSSTGPDEVTVRLSRADFRRRSRLARLRAGWRRVVLAMLAVGLLTGGVWAVFLSPYLTARGVTVLDAGDVGQARVEQAAQLTTGVPLARVDLDGVRERVEAIPAVRSAEVSRSWPHTVRIQVVPRVPLALLGASEGDVPLALDEQGVSFGLPEGAPPRLPVVEVTDDVADDAVDEAVAEAAGVLKALPDDVAVRTQRVEVGSVDEISLVLRSGRRVVWGSAEQSGTKAEVLVVMLDAVPRSVDQVDVSVPGRPTTS